MAADGRKSFLPKTAPSLLRDDALHQYILETSVYPREHESLRELREATMPLPGAIMSCAPEEGQFLYLLLKLINAKKTIEIGVYTGYSLLCTALALPADGKVTAIDPDKESFELGLQFIEKAGVAHKIDFIEAAALPILDQLLEEEKEEGGFDFAFVDADKLNYGEYHKRLLKLVKVGGLIAYDNTVWFGAVVEAASPNPKKSESFEAIRKFFISFNKQLASDPCMEISQICIGDGITLCRRVV